jgi:hypothetical protein
MVPFRPGGAPEARASADDVAIQTEEAIQRNESGMCMCACVRVIYYVVFMYVWVSDCELLR